MANLKLGQSVVIGLKNLIVRSVNNDFVVLANAQNTSFYKFVQFGALVKLDTKEAIEIINCEVLT